MLGWRLLSDASVVKSRGRFCLVESRTKLPRNPLAEIIFHFEAQNQNPCLLVARLATGVQHTHLDHHVGVPRMEETVHVRPGSRSREYWI